ncbi:MAG: relaxase domain-containing protein [Pseudonocardia sp.]|nr:relaxase domain-containing protein [Pseudonocardia sp.]
MSAGAVDYLLRGSGCRDPEHQHGREQSHQHGQEREAGVGLEQTQGHQQAREQGPQQGVERGAARYFGSAVDHGEPLGRWGGRGLGLFGIEEGAEAGEDDVRAVFGKLQDPRTGEWLGRAPRQFKTGKQRREAAREAAPEGALPEQIAELERAASNDGRKAVAYYDFTFSPPKSVSVYYAALMAAGKPEEAAEVVAAHNRAVERAMGYAEQHVAWTRTGYHGRTVDGRSVGRYEAGEGLIWTKWGHSTNRENEPQIHTHVAVLNRLKTLSDGVVRALDGRGFRPIKEAIATAYERGLEEELVASRGVVFADRPDGKAREIVGVDPELCADASTRRAQTLDKAEELREKYVAERGREPNDAAMKRIRSAAALQTRAAKSGQAGPAAVATWAQDPERAARLVATVEAVADAAEAAVATGHPDVATGVRLDPAVPEQRAALLAAAVAEVQSQYATWTTGALVAAIDRRVGALPADAAGQARPAYLEALAREALASGNGHEVVLLTAPDPVTVPDELRRPQDGRSIFRPHLDDRYATRGQLHAEDRVVAGARQLGAPAMSSAEAELLRVELAAAGLGVDQADAVVGIVSSGRAGDVLIGPAGTGKSFTMSALAGVWSERFGGRVVGLATSQIASEVLAADGVPAMNTTRFLLAFGPGEGGEPPRQRVQAGDLFVVDEAGMSSTAELAAIAQIVADGGGKLVFTGDDAQLTSVGAGGLFSLLAADNGAYQLQEVRRFASEWEREASLRLRAGDTSVIPEYDDRGRLQAGTVEEMQAAALRGYLADTLSGKESLLIVGSNQAAADLSREIREHFIDYGRVAAEQLTELGERTGHTPVSVGDVVQARHNDRSIRVDGGGEVLNRATFVVLGLNEDGSLRVQGTGGPTNGQIAHLPADYVDEHVTLAYASTVNAAQGRTVDTSHGLLDEAAARESAYTTATRGREANHLYLVGTREPDQHEQERLHADAPARLAAVLGNTEAEQAAELERRAGARDGASLAWIGTQWDEVSKDSARARYTEALGGVLPAEAVEQVTAEAGWPRLVRAMREAELDGHSPHAVLAQVVEGRSLAGSEQLSDVLRYRVRTAIADRAPEQQVGAGDWTALAPPVDGPVGQFSHELAVMAGDKQHALGLNAAHDPPAWALAQLGPVPMPHTEQAERDAWIQRAAAIAAYREARGISDEVTSIGAAPSREEEFHHRLWAQAAAALGPQPDTGPDVRAFSDSDLYAARERWAREQAWAPEYVAEEMRAAYELGRDYDRDAALAGARLAALEPDEPEWEQTAEQFTRSQRLAEVHLERARQLEDVQLARGGWFAATEDARVGDELARAELDRRGLPQDRVREVKQLELFDPTAAVEQAPELEETPELEPTGEREPLLEESPAAEQLVEEPVRETAAGSEVDVTVEETQRAERDVEPTVEPAPEQAERETIERDQVVEEQPLERDQVVEGPVGEPTPAHESAEQIERETVERDQVEEEPTVEAPEQVEQLALIEATPRLEDEVAAQPLRDEPDAEVAPEGDDGAAAEQVQATLAEARRQADAAERQRLQREAAAAERAAQAEQQIDEPATARDTAEEDRARRDQALSQEQGVDAGLDRGQVVEYDQGHDDDLGLGL